VYCLVDHDRSTQLHNCIKEEDDIMWAIQLSIGRLIRQSCATQIVILSRADGDWKIE